MTQTTDHLDRPVLIYLWPSGKLDYTHKDFKPKGALPVFSVDTEEEAQQLQVALCRLSRHEDDVYFLPFTGDVRDLPAVTEMLEGFTRLKKQGAKAFALTAPLIAYKRALGLF